jgi:Putative transposase
MGRPPCLLDPAELLERLAALVPRPRTHLLVYHGLLAPRAGWRSAIVPVPAAGATGPSGVAGRNGPRPPARLSWATLLRRVFSLDVLVCPRCAGPRRILGAVTAPHAVRRVLAALGLAAEPPPGRPVTAA